MLAAFLKVLSAITAFIPFIVNNSRAAMPGEKTTDYKFQLAVIALAISIGLMYKMDEEIRVLKQTNSKVAAALDTCKNSNAGVTLNLSNGTVSAVEGIDEYKHRIAGLERDLDDLREKDLDNIKALEICKDRLRRKPPTPPVPPPNDVPAKPIVTTNKEDSKLKQALDRIRHRRKERNVTH
jgi:hypothetical protein